MISLAAFAGVFVVPDVFESANYAESVVWCVLAVVCAVYGGFRSGTVRYRCWEAAVILFVFGISDVLEARTHGDGLPWWLMIWKGVCFVLLLLIAIDAWWRMRLRKIAAESEAPSCED